MPRGALEIRRVRRYRAARYASRHRDAKRGGSIARLALRATAAPALAFGLGSAAAGCDEGVALIGNPDAEDAVDTSDDAGHDDAGTDDARHDDARHDDASADDGATDDARHDDASADDGATDDGWDDDNYAGGIGEGNYYVRYLTEAEGRALVAETAGEVEPVGPAECAGPDLASELVEDLDYSAGAGDPDAVFVNVDLLAPGFVARELPDCAGSEPRPVGFEFMTDERDDDEDLTGDPAGLTGAEEGSLGFLRDLREAAIVPLRSADYPYEVWDYDGWIDESDRARAEDLVRATVRAILDDLKRDGFI